MKIVEQTPTRLKLKYPASELDYLKLFLFLLFNFICSLIVSIILPLIGPILFLITLVFVLSRLSLLIWSSWILIDKDLSKLVIKKDVLSLKEFSLAEIQGIKIINTQEDDSKNHQFQLVLNSGIAIKLSKYLYTDIFTKKDAEAINSFLGAEFE